MYINTHNKYKYMYSTRTRLLPILIGEPLAIIARGGNLGYIFCLKLDQTGRSTGPS